MHTITTALHRGPAATLGELLARYLEEYLAKIEVAVSTLHDEALWHRPQEPVNSVANLLLHLAGNLSLWILHGVGGKTISRDRSGEFAARGGVTRAELLARLGAVVTDACAILRDLDEERLAEVVEVQGYRVDRRGAAVHAVEHMSYHTGQILQLAKLLAPGSGIELYPQHRGE